MEIFVRKVGSCVYLNRIVVDFICVSLRCVSLDLGIFEFNDMRNLDMENLLEYGKSIRI